MITWNVADLFLFLLQLEETYPWHVLFFQEAFKKTDNLSVDRGHRLFSATEGLSWFRGPAILIREDFASAFNVTFLGSGVRWVAATVPGVALLLSVHLPHKRQTFLQFLDVLQEVRYFVESQTMDNLKLIVGIDANVQMSACMDHLRVGPAVPCEDEDFNHSSLQRASSLFEWLTDSDLRLVNTFMDEDTGRITTRDDWNTGSPSQIDFVISSNSLAVWATLRFDEQTPGPTFTSQRVHRAPLGWKAGPTWNGAAAGFDWDWASNWSDFSSNWCELATKHQLRKSQKNDQTLAALFHDRKCAVTPEERRTLNKAIWRYRRKRNRARMNEAVDATLFGAKKPERPKPSVVNWRRICGTNDPKTKLEERFTDFFALTPEEQTRENGEKHFWVRRWLAVCEDPMNVPCKRFSLRNRCLRGSVSCDLGRGALTGVRPNCFMVCRMLRCAVLRFSSPVPC